MAVDDKFSAIRKGLLELLILKIAAAGRVYAGDIMAKLRSSGFPTQEGTLYPLLSRLRREQLLGYEWIESEAGPPRKYYTLTSRGRTQLAELSRYWESLNATVESLGQAP
ncbi:MAG: PadR family transcriptional regulator [Gammaproteobacteria bacterium]|nr:PadR family transcriptional regulator [Gammaproteobacteria bacterium]